MRQSDGALRPQLLVIWGTIRGCVLSIAYFAALLCRCSQRTQVFRAKGASRRSGNNATKEETEVRYVRELPESAKKEAVLGPSWWNHASSFRAHSDGGAREEEERCADAI